MPVTDDLVLHLSELACIRLSLDALIDEWSVLAQDWEDEVGGRFDHLTLRQRQIITRRTTLFAELKTTQLSLSSRCPHPGYAQPPFASVTYIPTWFIQPSLCTLCLHPPA